MALKRVELTNELLASFSLAKVFPKNQRNITSISFNDTGEYCVVAAEDDSLNVYNCKEGVVRSTLYSKKYGVTLARFTHHKNNVIYASTKEDDTLRYLSIHDNKYIRYFRGHKKRVTAVEMSPINDTVMTASLDETIRMWDLRSSTCQGMIHCEGKSLVAIDPQGLVFAVGSINNIIRVYDSREYLQGPFATWHVQDAQDQYGRLPEWTSLKFSSDGTRIIITTMSDKIYVLDAFNGALLQRLVGHAGPSSLSCGEEVCITPDARSVMAGGRDNCVRVWDLNNQSVDNLAFTTLVSPHKSGIKVCGFNPLNAMAVTGGEEVAFWLPNYGKTPL